MAQTTKAHSPEQLKEIENIIKDGKEKGMGITEIARTNTKYKMNIYKRVNAALDIIPVHKRNTYTDAMKKLVLYYAKHRGVMDASREFNINDGIITEWNNIFHIYVPRENPDFFTKEEKIKILNEVNDYNNKNNTFSGPVVIAEKRNVSDSSIYNWNIQYQIFETQYSANFPKTDKNGFVLILKSATFCASINEISRVTAFSKELISKTLEQNGLYYNKFGLQKKSNNDIGQNVVQYQKTMVGQR